MLVLLFTGLVVGTVGFELFHDAVPGIASNRWVAYVLSLVFSTSPSSSSSSRSTTS